MFRSVVVTAFTDLTDEHPNSTRRLVSEYLKLAEPLLAQRVPMVIFCDNHLFADISAMRPDKDSAETWYFSIDQIGARPDWLTSNVNLLGSMPRPACLSNEVKDTEGFVSTNHNKIRFLQLAAESVDAAFYWWVDFGISHVCEIPKNFGEQVRYFPSQLADRLWIMSLANWKPLQVNELWNRNLKGITENHVEWWRRGAPLVAGGVFGVPANKVQSMSNAWAREVETASSFSVATSDEMVLSRIAFQGGIKTGIVSSSYFSLLTDLVSQWSPEITALCASTELKQLPSLSEDGWSTFNPSITQDPNGGYLAIVRQSNYRYIDGHYVASDPDDVIRTRNKLMHLDDKFEVDWVHPIDDSTARTEPAKFPVHGLEDARLFPFGHSWFLSATIREHRDNGLCEILVAELDGNVLKNHFVLQSPVLKRHEKNWMPVLGQSRLTFMWSAEPTTLITVDDVTGGQMLSRTISSTQSILRGGSQVIPISDGWLAVVHFVAQGNSQGLPRRVYRHRLIRFDSQLNFVEMSRDFVFIDNGIEFCAGLTVTSDGVVISFGRNDAEAWLATISWTDVWSLFVPELV